MKLVLGDAERHDRNILVCDSSSPQPLKECGVTIAVDRVQDHIRVRPLDSFDHFLHIAAAEKDVLFAQDLPA